MTERCALVTGATGLVGSAVARGLLAQKHPVRVFVRDVARARALFGWRVEIAAGDLRDSGSLRRACAGMNDVYHVAGAVDIHRHASAEMWETNVEGTHRVLEAARDAGVSRFVYTSSVSVYGDRLPVGLAEDGPLTPAGIYGASKVEAERLVREAAAGGLRATIIRPCIVYGPGDRYFIPAAAQVMRLPVLPLPDGGRHLVDLVHADDVAAAHQLVMEAGHPGEAYNVTDGGCYRARELLGWIAEALGRSLWFPSIPWRCAIVMRPLINLLGRLWSWQALAHLGMQELNGLFSDYHFDISKIAALGYAPRIGARTGLVSEFQAARRRVPVHEHVLGPSRNQADRDSAYRVYGQEGREED
jgi:nucleoside-diphosphate-sugar epimerase